MSLARLAMRLAAARALKGATLAGDRVFDSAIDPIDQTIAETRQPVLIVYTDDQEAEITGRDLMHSRVSCDLVIEAAIAARVEVPMPDGEGGETSIVIPHTDEGMELVLDIIEHQAVAALTRERSDWSRVWMKLVPKISKRMSRRGASSEKGVRFAARQITITCDLIEAPTDGGSIPAGGTWADLLAVMGADAQLGPIADMLRAEIEGDTIAEWRRAANMLGIELETADAIGLGPVLDLNDDPETSIEVVVKETGRADVVVEADDA